MAKKFGLTKKDALAVAFYKGSFSECQSNIQKKVDARIQDEMLWLDEIYHTVYTALFVKNEKLEQMPKTPSAKTKIQNRKRKKEDLIKAEESPPKLKVTRLKFEEPVANQEDTGRPVRKCRASKNVNKPKASPKHTRSKRHGADSNTSKDTPMELSSTDTDDQNEVSNRLSDGTVSTIKTNTLKIVERTVDENSPSVKTRIKDYENRIISPANKNGTKVCTPKTLSGKKSKKKTSFTPDIKEEPQDCPAPKQARTRLRLKKQQQIEPAAEVAKPKQRPDPNRDSETATSSTEPPSSEESDKEESEPEVIDSSLDNGRSPKAVSSPKSLSETHKSEVYELNSDGTKGTLHKHEVGKTKTTPASKESQPKESSKSKISLDDVDMHTDDSSPIASELPVEEEVLTGMSTRTRARAKPTGDSAKKAEKNKDSGVIVGEKLNSTFTADSDSAGSDEGIGRTTRTRARALKEKETAATTDGEKQNTKQDQAHSVQNLNKAQFLIDGSDEKITGSPATGTQRSPYRCAKRVIEHGRGLSPAPKRVRSNMGEELQKALPLSTSSPIRNFDESEMRDTVPSVSRAPRPYQFSSTQRKVSSFLNRTPGLFGTPNSSQLNSTRCTFLSKTSPSPQRGTQIIMSMEHKKRQLAEKQNKDKERLRRFEEKKKQELEKRRRDREERFQKAAALRQEQEEKKKHQEEQYMKKHGTTAAIKAKLQEEKDREEAEKRKLRQKKQIEADIRRKQEEEERLRRIQEQKEEARQQEALFLKKRKQEEMLRKQRLAEEKARNEERLAEKEQRLVEEKAKILQQQREKELLAEKARIEKENLVLQERLERERIEKERKAEKEKKLREEMERLKAMEKERLYLREQELQKQREMAEKERELKQVINNHNKSILTQKQQNSVPAQHSVMNTTQTLNTSKPLNTTHTLNTSKTANNSNSYDMTPAKIFKPNSSSDYGLDDRESDDSTDDEEAPKKTIPGWASGINLTTALIKQFTNPPDLEKIFEASRMELPSLESIFKGNNKKRYKQRTSSAIWNTPPIKY